MRGKDNRASNFSLKHIRLSLVSLLYRFNVVKDLSQSKANMKDILYMPLYTTGFFSVIS
ncbi:hypothetical protein H8356DRAFT_1055002 [Neocallimastix lanati (nom. inval.)]|nr:hypothetical protein H8356DRAFT_1055002 [Neocallimastix sp. JGI-2020a]